MCRLAILAAAFLGLGLGGASAEYDLSDPVQRLDAYVKTEGDLSGKDTIGYGMTTVFAKEPGKKAIPLFKLEVLGAGRWVPIEGGYRRLHREVAFYTDLETGEILDSWDNPLNGRTVKVFHVENDPVNFNYLAESEGAGTRAIAYDQYGDKIVFHREIMLRYPSALPRDEYPLNSQDDWYEAGEMFNSYVNKSDLDDPTTTSAPSHGSWSRYGPWLPWMEMGDTPGNLFYHGHSAKFVNGVDDIPPRLLKIMQEKYPAYLTAPESDYGPNETSWTVFKKLIDAEQAKDGN